MIGAGGGWVAGRWRRSSSPWGWCRRCFTPFRCCATAQQRNSARPGPAYWLGRASSACAKSDARAAEQALLLWARTVWGDAAPSSLLEIAARLEREEMAQLLRQLRATGRRSGAAISAARC
ncbi:MAG: hypothetical protein AB2807_08000 [Candidatus Sedimenticola endophacoides]